MGPLRFKPPSPLARPRAVVLDARRYGPARFQFTYNTGVSSPIPREQQSENCVTVNVLRSFDVCARSELNGTGTSGGSSGDGLPMNVWVHGGGFTEVLRRVSLAYRSDFVEEKYQRLMRVGDLFVQQFNLHPTNLRANIRGSSLQHSSTQVSSLIFRHKF